MSHSHKNLTNEELNDLDLEANYADEKPIISHRFIRSRLTSEIEEAKEAVHSTRSYRYENIIKPIFLILGVGALFLLLYYSIHSIRTNRRSDLIDRYDHRIDNLIGSSCHPSSLTHWKKMDKENILKPHINSRPLNRECQTIESHAVALGKQILALDQFGNTELSFLALMVLTGLIGTYKSIRYRRTPLSNLPSETKEKIIKVMPKLEPAKITTEKALFEIEKRSKELITIQQNRTAFLMGKRTPNHCLFTHQTFDMNLVKLIFDFEYQSPQQKPKIA